VAVVGEIVTDIKATMVTVADPLLVGSATEVATTFRYDGVGGIGGAVYSPVWLMVPQV
jgi:hypothetical protein